MSNDNMNNEVHQLSPAIDEAIQKSVEKLLPALLKIVEQRPNTGQFQEELVIRGKSPASSVSTQNDSGGAEAGPSVNRQPDTSIANDLAKTMFRDRNKARQGRRSSAAQSGTSSGVRKTRGKRRVRCKTEESYYVILEYDEPFKICRGWNSARRSSVGLRGRSTQRFDTKEEAEDFMNNPDITSDDDE